MWVETKARKEVFEKTGTDEIFSEKLSGCVQCVYTVVLGEEFQENVVNVLALKLTVLRSRSTQVNQQLAVAMMHAPCISTMEIGHVRVRSGCERVHVSI